MCIFQISRRLEGAIASVASAWFVYSPLGLLASKSLPLSARFLPREALYDDSVYGIAG